MSIKDRVTVASEKADFIADRIADGVPPREQEVRELARALRQVAADLGVGPRKSSASLPRTRDRSEP